MSCVVACRRRGTYYGHSDGVKGRAPYTPTALSRGFRAQNVVIGVCGDTQDKEESHI